MSPARKERAMPSETWWQRYERLRDEFGEAFGTGAEEGALEALDEHVRIFDSEGRFAMEEYREITDRLQQCVQRHRLGLGGERIDVLVCDEVDRLRAAHQERDADARRCKQCKVEIDVLCADCRAELRCEACGDVIEDDDFVSTLDSVYLHIRCAGDDE